MVAEPPVDSLLHSTIIIHPGSLNLRIGRATDAQPHQLLHAIARRCRPGGLRHHDPFLPRPIDPVATPAYAAIARDLDTCRSNLLHTLQTSLRSDGQRRFATPVQQVAAFNRRTVDQPIASSNPDTEPAARPAYTATAGADAIVGDDLLHIDPAELASDYNVHFPVRRGDLNVHAGCSGSVPACLADLQHIWTHAMRRLLHVQPDEMRSLRAVLIVPDIYNRAHLRELLTLLLAGIGFGSAFLVQDHVVATFGAGMPYACVVDCGDQKVSVSCVEDGISHPLTRVRLEYGGADVAQVNRWLMREAALPGRWPTEVRELERLDDALWVRRVAQDWCHLDLDRCGPQEGEWREEDARPGECGAAWTVQVGDDAMVAPLALFHTELLAAVAAAEEGAAERAAWVQRPAAQQPDAEDLFDAEYLRETGRKYMREQLDQSGNPPETAANNNTTLSPVKPGKAPADAATPTGDVLLTSSEDIDVVSDVAATPTKVAPVSAGVATTTRDYPDDHQRDFMLPAGGQIVGLDAAVLQSIERCGSDELKRKMYGAVLVVGGGLRFAGAGKWLAGRLALQTPFMFRSVDGAGGGSGTGGGASSAGGNGGAATPDVVTFGAKDGEPVATAWRGAAIMVGLESAPELFIKAADWQKFGVRVLREKAPFMW